MADGHPPAGGGVVTVDDRGPIVVVTLDRPARRNAISVETWQMLHDVMRDLATRPTVRGVLITGAGERAFAAGADVAELVDRPAMAALDTGFPAVLRELEKLPVPTVAALNGDALGGGFELALACDLRIAAVHARIGFPEVALGIMPGAGGTRRLLQHVGLGRAKELILCGRLLDAREAHAWGLVNNLVETHDVLPAATKLLNEVIDRPSLALRLAKMTLDATASTDATAEVERLAYTLTYHSPERVELMRRFLDLHSR